MAAGIMSGAAQAQAQTSDDNGEDAVLQLDTLVLSAEDQTKQALGASTITADDLAKTPVVNDISDIVRKMPGVNLTGTTAGGSRGNNRQIDIRGMGPENTMIMIDGKPVMSRNSVRMQRAGERDSRGDSNWVAPELIERIEVIRGPAAARYGSGAAGGVVNIITKRPTEQTSSIGLHFSQPESSSEGSTRRLNFMTAGPVGERLSFRLTGNYNKTDADDPEINDAAAAEVGNGTSAYAGREGVENKDLSGLLTWDVNENHSIDFELSYSRQGNIYTGDTGNNNADSTQVNPIVNELANAGAETNTMRRRVLGVTHRGEYEFGTSFSYFQWENTRNTRYTEAGAGGPEGSINSDQKKTITLDNYAAKTEWNLPLEIGGKRQMLTLGAEIRKEVKDDEASNQQTVIGGVEIPGTNIDPSQRNSTTEQTLIGLYVENNIEWSDKLTLTPALRYDHSSEFGGNWSPSLNATYAFTDEWSMKMGVARAFKAPNLFQLDPDYVYYTMGNGCPIDYPASGGVGCYVVGNPDLKPETSVNAEIGVAYQGLNGVNGSLTYFHNDYKNRISSGMIPVTDAANPTTGAGHVLQWENTPEAVVAGFEGNLAFPVGESFAFNANFTYMTESKNKQNGQPLSLIPEYTINASLDWFVNDQVTITTSATHYGKIEAAEVNATTGATYTNTDSRESYSIVNLGIVYNYDDTTRISGGVTNLFDKTLFRTGNGANTFNEPGRAFYISLNKAF